MKKTNWNQKSEELWILRELPIHTSQEVYMGLPAQMLLQNYLETLKKRTKWWDDVNVLRLRHLAVWCINHPPVVEHLGHVRYKVTYPAVVPGYSTKGKARTVFDVRYKD